MDNIFRNSWMTITRDKSSKPENYFSIINSKINSLSKKTSSPSSCNGTEIVVSESADKKLHSFYEHYCNSNDFGKPIMTISNKAGNDWDINLGQFESYKKVLGENRIGLGVTIDDSTKDSEQKLFDIKPHCTFTIKNENSSNQAQSSSTSTKGFSPEGPDLRVTKAHCQDLVQNYIPSSDRKEDRATLRILNLKYDRDNSSENELEVSARKISFDDNNIHCQGSKITSIAPKNSSSIEKHDDLRPDENQCERSRIASAKIAKAAQAEFLAHHSQPATPTAPVTPAANINKTPEQHPPQQANALTQNHELTSAPSPEGVIEGVDPNQALASGNTFEQNNPYEQNSSPGFEENNQNGNLNNQDPAVASNSNQRRRPGNGRRPPMPATSSVIDNAPFANDPVPTENTPIDPQNLNPAQNTSLTSPMEIPNQSDFSSHTLPINNNSGFGSNTGGNLFNQPDRVNTNRRQGFSNNGEYRTGRRPPRNKN